MSIEFSELPVWNGLKKEPHKFQVKAFSIDICPDGYICQPRNATQEIVEGYSDNSYSFITEPPGRSQWANHLAKNYIEFMEAVPTSWRNKRVVEIGGGTVYLGEYFLENHGADHWEVVDPACREASKHNSLSVQRCYFENFKFSKKFDVGVSINCFEHVLNPLEFLKQIKNVLNADGSAILIFPDIAQPFQSGDINVILHEHISYFDCHSAAEIFRRSGFSIQQWKSKNNTLYFFLQLGEEAQVTSDAAKVCLEKAKKQFQTTLDLMKFVESQIQANKKIAFYGATNGLNNLLYLTNMHQLSNFTIIDSDITKKGLYLPCSKVPVTTAEEANYKELDFIYVSAVTFINEIMDFLVNVKGVDAHKIKALHSGVVE